MVLFSAKTEESMSNERRTGLGVADVGPGKSLRGVIRWTSLSTSFARFLIDVWLETIGIVLLFYVEKREKTYWLLRRIFKFTVPIMKLGDLVTLPFTSCQHAASVL